jgi:hypothetical protein
MRIYKDTLPNTKIQDPQGRKILQVQVNILNESEWQEGGKDP